MAKEPVSVRKRISIPRVDESTLAWWELQQDAGVSIRMLIRAEIQRNGMTDVVNVPVTQQPRRGRPPLEADAGSIPVAAASSEALPAMGAVDAAASELGQPRTLEAVDTGPLDVPTPVPTPAASGASIIDSIINTH